MGPRAGIRSPDRPSRNQSLYRIRYPANISSNADTLIGKGIFVYVMKAYVKEEIYIFAFLSTELVGAES